MAVNHEKGAEPRRRKQLRESLRILASLHEERRVVDNPAVQNHARKCHRTPAAMLALLSRHYPTGRFGEPTLILTRSGR